MKRFFVFALRFLILGAIVFATATCGLFNPGGIPGNTRYAELEFGAEKALKYAQRKGLNENYCIFLDYGIPSGKPRLFVWSFSEGRVVYSGYAMHGPGRGSTGSGAWFSVRVTG